MSDQDFNFDVFVGRIGFDLSGRRIYLRCPEVGLELCVPRITPRQSLRLLLSGRVLAAPCRP